MNKEFLALCAFVLLCFATVIVVDELQIYYLQKEKAELLHKLDGIEVGFVIDARDGSVWAKVKYGKIVRAVSCDGDSVSFLLSNNSNDNVDTMFTKVLTQDISDAARARQNCGRIISIKERQREKK